MTGDGGCCVGRVVWWWGGGEDGLWGGGGLESGGWLVVASSTNGPIELSSRITLKKCVCYHLLPGCGKVRQSHVNGFKVCLWEVRE